MISVDEEISPRLQMLLLAIDALDAAGFTFWTMVECDNNVDVETFSEWLVEFRDFPDEMPVLESEITLLAGVLREIMLLGAKDNTS